MESIIYFSHALQQIIYVTLFEPNIIYFKYTPAPPPPGNLMVAPLVTVDHLPGVTVSENPPVQVTPGGNLKPDILTWMSLPLRHTEKGN